MLFIFTDENKAQAVCECWKKLLEREQRGYTVSYNFCKEEKLVLIEKKCYKICTKSSEDVYFS